MVVIIINGQKWLAKNLMTLSELLEELQYAGKRVAIELNGLVVPKSQYSGTVLQAGDKLEIIVAVGGG